MEANRTKHMGHIFLTWKRSDTEFCGFWHRRCQQTWRIVIRSDGAKQTAPGAQFVHRITVLAVTQSKMARCGWWHLCILFLNSREVLHANGPFPSVSGPFRYVSPEIWGHVTSFSLCGSVTLSSEQLTFTEKCPPPFGPALFAIEKTCEVFPCPRVPPDGRVMNCSPEKRRLPVFQKSALASQPDEDPRGSRRLCWPGRGDTQVGPGAAPALELLRSLWRWSSGGRGREGPRRWVWCRGQGCSPGRDGWSVDPGQPRGQGWRGDSTI